MNITFYTFSKKLNSTKRPTGGSSYNCTLKRGSSKMAPYIELSAADPTNYNYAYIPAYGRYYYIDNWTFQEGLWSCDMSVDVLATFKTEIGRTPLYVLRSSEEYNGKVLDTLYPTTGGGSGNSISIPSPWNMKYSEGSYVVGVISKSAAAGAVAYYVLSYTDMAAFRNMMMNQTTTPAWGSDWDITYPNISGELIKSLINPFQYVASCTWFPFDMPSAGSAAMDFGFWDSGLAYPTLNSEVYTLQAYFDIPQPYKDGPEEWRLLSPYAKYQLDIEPFGCIDLDTSILINDTSVGAFVYVDPITGSGRLEIVGTNTKHLYATVSAQVGVPVQIAQISSDVLGSATALVNGVTDAVSGALTGDIAGAIKGGVNGLADATRAAMPTVCTTSSNGGLGNLAGYWVLRYFFYDTVNINPALNGRPLCDTKLPAALSGYIVARDGSVIDCPGSKEEKTELKSFIEGGFYYE